MCDPEFYDLQKILDSYYRKLHQEGAGCSSKSTELLTRQDEEKLWRSGVLNPLICHKGCLTVYFSLTGRTSACVMGKNIVN